MPMTGALAVVTVFGAFLFASGAMLVSLGLRMRSLRERLTVQPLEERMVG
jgi:hypothetical protein